MSNSLPLSSAITSCSSSFFLEETRSSSPCTWALTPFGPSSLMILEIFLASSCDMPSLRPTLIRYSLPDGFGSPTSSTLSETERLTSFSLKTSSTALARSSLLALISMACLPDHAMEAPTPRKSKRVPISLAAWLTALSTSSRLIFDTTSNDDSAGMALILERDPAGYPNLDHLCGLVSDLMADGASHQVAEREHVEHAAKVQPVVGERQAGWLVFGERGQEHVDEARRVAGGEPRHVGGVAIGAPGEAEFPVKYGLDAPAAAHPGHQQVLGIHVSVHEPGLVVDGS